MKQVAIIICVLLFTGSCSGIKLSDNCNKKGNEKSYETFVVLPFVNDNHNCHIDIEAKLKELCYYVYDVESGISLINRYACSVNKSIDEIDIIEFCDYAKKRGINYVVLGNCRVEWFEGRKSTNTMNTNSENKESKSLEDNMYYIVTGNYAIVNCYYINTENRVQKELFRNYKIKKVHTGTPNSF